MYRQITIASDPPLVLTEGVDFEVAGAMAISESTDYSSDVQIVITDVEAHKAFFSARQGPLDVTLTEVQDDPIVS